MSDGLSPSWGLTVLRVVVGAVYLIHGGQKLFVWGFQGVAGFLASVGIPLPGVAAVVLTLVELLGGAALLVGVLTRWAAVLNGIDMLVAIFLVHLKKGFFSANDGIELPLLLLAACIALALAGPGAASVEGALARRE